MKILVDMNLAPTLVQALQKEGFEAVHWSSVGDPRATDSAILEWADANGFVVLTHDLDFGAILAATGGRGPSVVQVRTQAIMPDRLVPVLVSLLHQHQAAIEAGAIVVAEESRARVRILPMEKL
jgi:predicted nuclease of predicted toxin-antitoxin system